ncbi:MAG: hypothetical protein U1F65_06125 [Verrucomicrobiota bacterium]
MRERLGPVLKLACAILGAMLLYQLVQVALRVNPLRGVAIPALPRLASDTNTPAAGGAPTAAKSGTNPAVRAGSTNLAAMLSTNAAATNVIIQKAKNTNTVPAVTAELGTNSPTDSKAARDLAGTSAPTSPTPALVKAATNSPAETSTNSPLAALAASPVIGAGTNVAVAGGASTNAPPKKSKATNSPSMPAMAMSGMNPSMRGGSGGGKSTEPPPEIKARVDRIYESELFGQIIRPMPMALLGIAGNSAMLRTPSGQTGLVKEGDSLGELKLLRIGINRVLVEQDGNKSELMIFNGYGGESLMPKDKEISK